MRCLMTQDTHFCPQGTQRLAPRKIHVAAVVGTLGRICGRAGQLDMTVLIRDENKGPKIYTLILFHYSSCKENLHAT